MSGDATDYTREFIRRALPGGANRLLEIGCGEGALAARLAADGFAVVALDSEQACVDAALGLGVDARLAAWPDFTDGRFDAVLFTRSLHHVADLDASVAAAFAALGPGGRVIVEDFDFAFADKPAFDWFAGAVRAIAASGADFGESALLAGLVEGGQAPLDVWRAEHHHDLHSAAAIEAALRASGRSPASENAAYFFRYVERALPADHAAADTLREQELAEIASGRIKALGRRFIAER